MFSPTSLSRVTPLRWRGRLDGSVTEFGLAEAAMTTATLTGFKEMKYYRGSVGLDELTQITALKKGLHSCPHLLRGDGTNKKNSRHQVA